MFGFGIDPLEMVPNEARALNVNPFDQPSVELIKIETKKTLS